MSTASRGKPPAVKPVKVGSYRVAVETGRIGAAKKAIGKGLTDYNLAKTGS